MHNYFTKIWIDTIVDIWRDFAWYIPIKYAKKFMWYANIDFLCQWVTLLLYIAKWSTVITWHTKAHHHTSAWRKASGEIIVNTFYCVLVAGNFDGYKQILYKSNLIKRASTSWFSR